LAKTAELSLHGRSASELRANIQPERSPKAMGQVMAGLKAKHGDVLDSRAARAAVKTALS
jgi:uncharacterized protein YqeY